MTWASLRHEASTLLPQLAQQLADATWQPGPLREVEIVTYTGKRTPTFVPPVIDRLVHRAMRNTIEPILEAHAFQDWVSGFRPGRSRITALRQVAAHRQDGYRWVADLDVASVSEGATVDEAITWHAEHIHDGAFLARLRTALAAMPESITPGSGLAPLLINLRLAQVDRLLSAFWVVRFADNYAAFARVQHDAEEAFFAVSAPDAAAPQRAQEPYPHRRQRRRPVLDRGLGHESGVDRSPGRGVPVRRRGPPVVVRTLLWTRTPIANGHLPDSPDGLGPRFPVTEVSHVEATEIAARLGGRLPLSAEWEWMAAGPRQRCWPWGDLDWQPAYANLRDSGRGSVTPVDTHPDGATPDGLQNVWEWTSSTTMGEGAVLRGEPPVRTDDEAATRAPMHANYRR
jgi:hypothetical protein